MQAAKDMKSDRDRVFAPLENSKVFKDPIHGDIILHPLLVAIVDTPQFQRLRSIRQLGSLDLVYRGGSHTRFQHCIGTAHLAGVFVQKLCDIDPTLPVDANDVLSVQIAALLHDLGHGPYSHMFDGRFLPRAAPDRPRIHHEELSIRMFTYLRDENERVREALKHYGMTDRDIVFIEELIFPKAKKATAENEWPYEGRGREKAFLYEIVSNKLTGVDVDKFDYLARDTFHLGIQCTFDHLRFITFCKVIPDEKGIPRIVARDKEAVKYVPHLRSLYLVESLFNLLSFVLFSLYDMYQQRYRLHLTAYQHKTGLVIQEM